MMSVEFFLEGMCAPLLGILGFFGNVISVVVMSSKDLEMMPSIKHLLKMLGIFDSVFLLFTLGVFSMATWSDHYRVYIKPYLTPYALPFIQISLTGSIWTTVAISVERYLTICLNFRLASTEPNKMHLFYTLPIVLFSIAFNVPRFFDLRTHMVKSNITAEVDLDGDLVPETTMVVGEAEIPLDSPTAFRTDPGYSRDYVLIANSLVCIFVPIVSLVFLNGLIFRKISRATRRHNAISSNQRRDHSVAMMLILIVVVFVICHSIRTIVNGFECVQFSLYGEVRHWPDWIRSLIHVNHFALVVNASINILIYALKDEKFRKVLLATLVGLWKKSATAATAAAANGAATNRRTLGNRAAAADVRMIDAEDRRGPDGVEAVGPRGTVDQDRVPGPGGDTESGAAQNPAAVARDCDDGRLQRVDGQAVVVESDQGQQVLTAAAAEREEPPVPSSTVEDFRGPGTGHINNLDGVGPSANNSCDENDDDVDEGSTASGHCSIGQGSKKSHCFYKGGVECGTTLQRGRGETSKVKVTNTTSSTYSYPNLLLLHRRMSHSSVTALSPFVSGQRSASSSARNVTLSVDETEDSNGCCSTGKCRSQSVRDRKAVSGGIRTGKWPSSRRLTKATATASTQTPSSLSSSSSRVTGLMQSPTDAAGPATHHHHLPNYDMEIDLMEDPRAPKYV